MLITVKYMSILYYYCDILEQRLVVVTFVLFCGVIQLINVILTHTGVLTYQIVHRHSGVAMPTNRSTHYVRRSS